MKKILLFLFFVSGIALTHSQVIGIVGPAANGWPDGSNPTPDIMLTDNGDGTHSIDALTLTTGPAKFRENQQWVTDYGGDTFPSGPVTSGNIPVQAGVYDIVLDLNTNTYTFTDVSTFTDIELTGSALSSSQQMSTINGINYELSVTLFNDGDILFQEIGTTNTFGVNSFPTGTVTAGGTAIPVQFGFYEVSFNLSTGDFVFSIPDVGIVGSAVNGWPDGNNPTPDIAMSSTDGDVYSLNSQVLNDGELKFRQNFSWDVNWGGTDFPSGALALGSSNNIPVNAGTYDISFFRDNLTYTFTSLSVEDLSFTNFKLYPNPTQDNWIFENPSKAIKSISIYDTFGKLVHEVKPNSNSGYVSAQTFSQGLYLAKVKLIDDTETTVKIIKR